MPKATDQLLKDHKMIRKLLEGFHIDNERFNIILETITRVVRSHAWFENEIFLPAFKAERLLAKQFTDEIIQEHKDLDFFLAELNKTPRSQKKELDALAVQMRSILENHLRKEEEGLFPMAEKILDSEGLNKIGDEMERRKKEVVKLFE